MLFCLLNHVIHFIKQWLNGLDVRQRGRWRLFVFSSMQRTITLFEGKKEHKQLLEHQLGTMMIIFSFGCTYIFIFWVLSLEVLYYYYVSPSQFVFIFVICKNICFLYRFSVDIFCTNLCKQFRIKVLFKNTEKKLSTLNTLSHIYFIIFFLFILRLSICSSCEFFYKHSLVKLNNISLSSMLNWRSYYIVCYFWYLGNCMLMALLFKFIE